MLGKSFEDAGKGPVVELKRIEDEGDTANQISRSR